MPLWQLTITIDGNHPCINSNIITQYPKPNGFLTSMSSYHILCFYHGKSTISCCLLIQLIGPPNIMSTYPLMVIFLLMSPTQFESTYPRIQTECRGPIGWPWKHKEYWKIPYKYLNTHFIASQCAYLRLAINGHKNPTS